MPKVFLQTITVCQLVKKYPNFPGNRIFIIVFTAGYHLHLSWAWWKQSTTLLSRRHSFTPSSINYTLSFGVLEKMLYIIGLVAMCATCSTQLILPNFNKLITIGEEWKLNVKLTKKITFSTVQRPVCFPQFDNRCANKHQRNNICNMLTSQHRVQPEAMLSRKISNWMFQQAINFCQTLSLKCFLTFINNPDCP